MTDPVQWFDHQTNTSEWYAALDKVRRLATREGYRYQHVQALIVAIDQYAESATGNRSFFLNKPHTIP